jgi:hypothetical protein
MRRGFAVACALGAACAFAVGHVLAVRGGGGCPLGASADPVAQDAQRVRAMERLAGDRAAPAEALEALASREAFLASAEVDGARCEDESGGALVRCVLGSRDEERVARVDPEGRLVAVDAVRYGLTSTEAARTLADLAAKATASYGAPARAWGEPTEAFLDAPLRQAGFSYRFRDVALDVTVTRLEGASRGGIVLRTQHRAVPVPARGRGRGKEG